MATLEQLQARAKEKYPHLGVLANDVQEAKDRLDEALAQEVRSGATFAELAWAMGLRSEGAVRLKAQRRGWYESGSRRA